MDKSILVSLVILCSFSGCSPHKKFVSSVPFNLGETTWHQWSGGREASGSETILQIALNSRSEKDTLLQKAYFKGKVAQLQLENTAEGWFAKASFMNNKIVKPDIIMHNDPQEEFGNQPPSLEEEFPFYLKEDECVISFLHLDTVQFYKITGVKEKPKKLFH